MLVGKRDEKRKDVARLMLEDELLESGWYIDASGRQEVATP